MLCHYRFLAMTESVTLCGPCFRTWYQCLHHYENGFKCCTCYFCLLCLFYHTNSDKEYPSMNMEEPCSCRNYEQKSHECIKRYAILVVVSLFCCPTLIFYHPLNLLLKLCRSCYFRTKSLYMLGRNENSNCTPNQIITTV